MKIAIVTGASSGIGRDFVELLKQKNELDEIWAIARRKERLEELAKHSPVPIVSVPIDLTVQEDIQELNALLEKRNPRVELLINCAGFAKFGGFGDIKATEELRMIDVNVRALVELTQIVVPFVPQGGRVIQIASTASFQPLPDMNVYAATKAFVWSYSRALNIELQQKGITVTTVCPGWTDTEFFDVAEKDADGEAVQSFPFKMKSITVAKKALASSKNERALCIPGIINKGHFFFAKLLPASFIMFFWKLMK